MTRGIDALSSPGFDSRRRLGTDQPLLRQRAWPFRERGWTALLSAGGSASERSCAVLRPPGPWPEAIERSFARGRARWLLDQGVVAWPLGEDPLVAGTGDWRDPARFDLASNGPRARVVGYKPLRRLVTSFSDDHGRPRCFVKHLRASQARRVAGFHRLLEQWWHATPDLSVPELMAGSDGGSHLVWRAAPGVPLATIREPETLAAAIAAAGRCLGSLHSCPTPVEPSRTRESELGAIETWLGVMRPLLALPGMLEDALSALSASLPHLPAAQPVLSHGDFHDGQLLLDGDAVTLLDIDTLAMAEPELDAGNFLAHLDVLACEDRPTPVELDELFLEGYAQGNGPALEAARITWYRAATAVRLACVHAPRQGTGAKVRWLTHRAGQLVDCLWQAREEDAS